MGRPPRHTSESVMSVLGRYLPNTAEVDFEGIDDPLRLECGIDESSDEREARRVIREVEERARETRDEWEEP